MRIVAVADTHLFHEDLEVPDGDVFVHAGDLCRGGDLDELAKVADWIAGLPHAHKVIVAGNHDWAVVHEPAAARSAIAGMTYLQDGDRNPARAVYDRQRTSVRASMKCSLSR